MTTRLIVNADDFGLSPGVNVGVIHGHDSGIVTSASLMVYGTAARAAASAAARRPALSLGLHFELSAWEIQDGEWACVLERAPAGDAAAVAAELGAQLACFERLTGHAPTHIDSHQHVHHDEPVRSVVREAAARLRIPVRHYGPVRYCGGFYGQDSRGAPYPAALSADALASLVSTVARGATTELACHPAAMVDIDSTYARERVVELAALCDKRVRHAIERAHVRLSNFSEVKL